jgi:serine protease Do
MEGAPIVTVFENGPCKEAGVQPGDVLLAIDSKPTPNARSVIRIIGWEKNIGDEVTLLIRREGEDEDIEVSVTLTGTPAKLER